MHWEVHLAVKPWCIGNNHHWLISRWIAKAVEVTVKSTKSIFLLYGAMPVACCLSKQARFVLNWWLCFILRCSLFHFTFTKHLRLSRKPVSGQSSVGWMTKNRSPCVTAWYSPDFLWTVMIVLTLIESHSWSNPVLNEVSICSTLKNVLILII